jgi:molybdenum cofactor cytidylyltransferase
MGESKALLRFGNWTALELAVRNAAAAGVGRVVAVIGHRAEEVRAAHTFTGIGVDFSWVLNRVPDSEQVESLKVGLRALERESLEAFLFQPVDYPLVTKADIAALLRAHRTHAGPERVFIPTCGQRRGHPVLCRAKVREAILELAPGQTARDALERSGVVHVEVSNPGILEDMNTPEDYKRLREAFRREHLSGPGGGRGRL